MNATSAASSPRPVKDAILPLDSNDLEQRIALASSSDTCKGMFHNGLFLSAQRAQGDLGLERMKAAARGQKYVDFFNYPIAEFLPQAWAAAEIVGGKEGLAAGIRLLGRQATDDFLSTAVGKTLLLLAGSDPKRMMNSLPAGYKTAVSYGTRTVTWKTSAHCVFSMKRDFMPHPYHEGVLLQVLTAVGGKNVQAKGHRVGLLDTDYEITWS